MSRIQFAIKQLLSKDEIMKLRVKHLQLSIKPEISDKRQVQVLENSQFKESRPFQIIPANEAKEQKFSDIQDQRDEIQPINLEQNKSIQDLQEQNQIKQDNSQDQISLGIDSDF